MLLLRTSAPPKWEEQANTEMSNISDVTTQRTLFLWFRPWGIRLKWKSRHGREVFALLERDHDSWLMTRLVRKYFSRSVNCQQVDDSIFFFFFRIFQCDSNASACTVARKMAWQSEHELWAASHECKRQMAGGGGGGKQSEGTRKTLSIYLFSCSCKKFPVSPLRLLSSSMLYALYSVCCVLLAGVIICVAR